MSCTNREATLKADELKLAEFQKTNDIPIAQEEARAASTALARLKAQLQEAMLNRQMLAQGLAPASIPDPTNIAVSVSETNQAAGAAHAETSVTNAVANATNSLSASSMNNDIALRLKNARIEFGDGQGRKRPDGGKKGRGSSEGSQRESGQA